MRPCVVKVVGPSGSGKTSAIVAASRILKGRGLRVAVVKHTHHDIDTPGKDSWRFLEEGGVDFSVVVKGGGERVAFFTSMKPWEVLELIGGLVDVVLVEGFKGWREPGWVEVDVRSLRGPEDLASLVGEVCLGGRV